MGMKLESLETCDMGGRELSRPKYDRKRQIKTHVDLLSRLLFWKNSLWKIYFSGKYFAILRINRNFEKSTKNIDRVTTWSFGNQETQFGSPIWIKATNPSATKNSIQDFSMREEEASVKTKASSSRSASWWASISIQTIVELLY